jgi:energy-coupling factor transport system ATP-binding protein
MITLVHGVNFSGRSEYIRSRTFFGRHAARKPRGCRYVYFDLNVPSFFSGVASTVAQELRLSTVSRNSNPAVAHIIDALDFKRLELRNPYVLSGGEQTVLGTLISLLLEPKAIGIDCAMEQLSQNWRRVVIPPLSSAPSAVDGIYLADNRDGEFEPSFQEHMSHLNMDVPVATPTITLSLPGLQINPCRITLSGLRFRYPNSDFDILSGLDFDLTPGRIYQLAGPNGVGKSTLSRLLAGLLKPVAGRCVVNGSDEVALARQPGAYFAYHFQNPDYQLFSSSVQHEIAISLPVGSSNPAGWLDCFGLAHFAENHPLDLPYTLRKRLGLAIAFAMQRPWLILDEPSLGQDRNTVKVICAMCREYASHGGGLIVISHSIELAEILQPVMITLKDGHLW